MVDPTAGWVRSLLRGVNEIALERGWALLLYSPASDVEWLLREWDPSAVIVGPDQPSPFPIELAGRVVVGANVDPSLEGMALATVDDGAVAELAAEHLMSKQLEHFAAFSFEADGWAERRMSRFRDRITEAGRRCHPSGGLVTVRHTPRRDEGDAIRDWLRALPKPCGVFGCCDTWARVVAGYCRGAGLRIPEDVALVGADNDPVECELTVPALSSVAIPWRELGREVAALVQRGLEGRARADSVLVRPTHVEARRSSDLLAVHEPLVARALEWIHEHSDESIRVSDVVKAVKTYRQRLERLFRSALDRSVAEEVRRSRVERAKRLLVMTQLSLPEVATRSGFTSASLLSVAFRREARTTPGAFRRRARSGRATE